MKRQAASDHPLILYAESLFLTELYTLVYLASAVQWTSGGAVGRTLSFCIGAVLLAAIHFLLRGCVRVEMPRFCWTDAVALLLFCYLYLSRAPISDLAWDTENYHIYAQESLLRDPFRMDFFPVRSINLNMLIFGEMVAGTFRHVLGYRLGTVYTLLILITAYFQLKRLLRLLGVRWRESGLSLAAALAVLSDGMLLLLGCYYVDTLSVPLILEALLFLFRQEEVPGKAALWLGYVAGMAVSLKVSNAYLVLILAAVWLVLNRKGLRLLSVAGAALTALLPLALFLIRGWIYAGNPLFPYANEVFRSPLFFTDQTVNQYADLDGRFGPETLQQALLWPFYILTDPHRMSDERFTTGRLAISYVTLFLALATGVRKKDRKLWGFATIYGLFYLVYLIPMQGYLRYLVVLDLMGGAMTVALLAAAFRTEKNRKDLLTIPRRGIALALAAALLGQTGWLLWQHQTTAEADTAERLPLPVNAENWMRQLAYTGKDRKEAVDPEITAAIDVWLTPLMGSSYATMIDPGKPMWGVGSQVLSTPDTEEEQMALFQSARDQGLRLWCAVSSWAADQHVQTLNKYGFRVINSRPVHLSFTQDSDAMLLECEWVGREGDGAYSPAATTWTIIDTDLSAWENVTVAVSMSGKVSKWEEGDASYVFVVELIDPEGHLVERLEPMTLTYGGESEQLRLENLAERNIRTLRIYPDGEPLPGALMIIQHDGELTDAGLAAWMDVKYR